MAAVSFIEYVFPQFLPHLWRVGIAIFHAGGVSEVRAYGEMVSGKIKAGIGERYDVRIKLHAHGKCVQWMECTCQSYRRHSQKCPHIAAFCICLDQDHPDLLSRMNLSAGSSEKYLRQDFPSAPETRSEVRTEGLGESVLDSKPLTSGFSFDNIFAVESEYKIVSFDLSSSPPYTNLTLTLSNRKPITYFLGIDDTVRLLQRNDVLEMASKRLKALFHPDRYARRFFRVERDGPDRLIVTRNLSIHDDKEARSLALADIEPRGLGRQAVFLASLGFLPLQDGLSLTQVQRWEEYPKAATLDSDTAATLVETKFERLTSTTEVVFSAEIANLKVIGSWSISELKLTETADGQFIVDAELGLAAEDVTIIGPKVKGRRKQPDSILLAILRARAEGKGYVTTKKGWIKISDDFDWLQQKISADGLLKLSAVELIKFHEQLAKGSEISGVGDAVARIRSGLVGTTSIDYPDLSKTRLTLRPYQEDGVKWLWWLFENRLGGLLCDEMGLGKTHQAMGLLAGIGNTHKDKISLVVCPTSVIDHWLDKLKRFVPGLDAICYHGSQRRTEDLIPSGGHRVIVTSYGILLRDIALFMTKDIALIILDEAHLVKNQATRTYRAACRLSSLMRLCLTGTPLENDLMELKNLFDYILPNYLGTDSDFKKRYLTNPRSDGLAELGLQRLIHPFKMRRNKIDVLTDLPGKVEDIRHCHFNKEQKKLYDEALALKGSALVDMIRAQANPVPFIHVFALITLLKQICDDPGLIDPRYETVGSGKLAVLDELLEEAIESNQKIVIFSQYAKMIDRLGRRLTQKGIRHVSLTGTTTKRGEVIREFQENSEVKVFLGSLLAGGTGIDLTAASVVIHFDRWWNAAKENQATDRVHRIGQSKNVQVFKLVTKGTLEERIDEIINRKRDIFDRFVDHDKDLFKHLSRDDLLSLLAPPEASSTDEFVEVEGTETDAYCAIDK